MGQQCVSNCLDRFTETAIYGRPINL